MLVTSHQTETTVPRKQVVEVVGNDKLRRVSLLALVCFNFERRSGADDAEQPSLDRVICTRPSLYVCMCV